MADKKQTNDALMARLSDGAGTEPMLNEPPPDFMAQLAALQTQLEAMKAAQSPAVGLNADQLEAMLSRVTKAASAGSELLASKMRPENVDHLHMGPFEHPEGGLKYPKEDIWPSWREIVYAGRIQRVEEVNYPEALAVRALSDSLARGQRRLCRGAKWKAIVNDEDTRLFISVPMKALDDMADLPSFVQICQELTSGQRQQDAGELAAEVALLRAEVARLAAQAAA